MKNVLDKTPMVGKEDEEYEESDDKEMEVLDEHEEINDGDDFVEYLGVVSRSWLKASILVVVAQAIPDSAKTTPHPAISSYEPSPSAEMPLFYTYTNGQQFHLNEANRSAKWGTINVVGLMLQIIALDTTNNVGAMLMLGKGLKIVSTLTHLIPPPFQSPETSPELLQHDTCMEVKMDDPNITMEEYIKLEEEKARKRGKEFN
ncbi:hypothetical protein Tco_0428782 [Tanacetum coccineum]